MSSVDRGSKIWGDFQLTDLKKEKNRPGLGPVLVVAHSAKRCLPVASPLVLEQQLAESHSCSTFFNIVVPENFITANPTIKDYLQRCIVASSWSD